MRTSWILFTVIFMDVATALPVFAETGPGVEFTTEQVAFFENRIRPILVERCYSCHSRQAKTVQGGLKLDDLASLRRGGDLGSAIDPLQLDASLLLDAIRYSDDLQMPPSGKLPDAEIDLLETWVLQGAPMPASDVIAAVQEQIDWERARQFWSFQPLVRHTPALIDDWAQNAVDAFIAERLRRAELLPTPAASRRTLIRRLYFDLLGSPPTQDQVDEFERDVAPQAWHRLVDRTLANPAVGERWGRYWLDNARYTDTTSEWLEIEGSPYLYRDWIVAAINEDLPYDDFVRLQLAADAIDNKRTTDNAALGFLGLSPTYWKELRLDPVVIEGVVASEWEERVDTVGRTFLGLTIACARCHDHKFDPITSRDYYGLAGVFANTRLADAAMIPASLAAPAAAARQHVTELEGEIKALRAIKPPPDDLEERVRAFQSDIASARTTPHFDTPVASGVADAALHVEPDGPDMTKLVYRDEFRDIQVQIRGNPATKGDTAPRQFIELFRNRDDPFREGSGRRELAEAIVTDAQSLCARVIVNRVWQHHFGKGLVDTPSNFGAQGDRPTHPELLDDLAARLIEHGWSLKWLHREILVSATYQQASSDSAAGRAADPGNSLLWRMNRRSVGVEAWRDAMLTVSGELDSRIGGPPEQLSDIGNRRRTVYGLINRRDLETLLRLHDFPDPTAHSPSRRPTVTPLQQLFVLNSPFVRARSEALAERLAQFVPDGDDGKKIGQAFHWLYQRAPQAWEVESIQRLLSAFQSDGEDEAWRRCAQVLLGANEFMFVD